MLQPGNPSHGPIHLSPHSSLPRAPRRALGTSFLPQGPSCGGREQAGTRSQAPGMLTGKSAFGRWSPVYATVTSTRHQGPSTYWGWPLPFQGWRPPLQGWGMPRVLEPAPWAHPWAGCSKRMGNPSQPVPHADGEHPWVHSPPQPGLAPPPPPPRTHAQASLTRLAPQLAAFSLSSSSLDSCCHLAGPWGGDGHGIPSALGCPWGHRARRDRLSLSPPGTGHPPPEQPQANACTQGGACRDASLQPEPDGLHCLPQGKKGAPSTLAAWGGGKHTVI